MLRSLDIGTIGRMLRSRPAILLAMFLVAYWIPLQAMVNVWRTNEDYSYGFLIPVISAYLLYERRRVLKEVAVRSEWAVFPLVVLFVLISLYGILGSSGNVSMPSIPVLIILFTVFCFGREIFKKLFLPLAFLVFMTPIPGVIERTLGMALKAIATQIGGGIIRTFGIPVHVSGNIIDIGVMQLQVVDACSGMRYLFPLLALGVLYAYFFERVLWKRVVAVIATLPIAVITNSIRVGITGILATQYGPKVADGFFHGFSGWVIFMVAFIFLFLLGRVLRLFPSRESSGAPKADLPAPQNPVGPGRRGKDPAFYTSIGLLLVVAALSWSTKALPPVMLKGGIASFPLEFKGWQGRPEYMDPEIILLSGAEESFSGLYRNSHDDEISLYIGYRRSAFLENENFFHSPDVCLPAAGWKIKKKTVHTIRDVPSWGELKVSKLLIEYMGNEQLVYYWFQTKSRTSHDKNINRFHLALHAMTRDNTYDLFIRPIMPIRKEDGVEKTAEKMDQFVREMMEVLLHFLHANSTYEVTTS